MKKLLVFIVLFFGFQICSSAHAQSVYSNYKVARERNMGISLSPLQLLFMSVDGKYAVKLNDRFAVTIPFVVNHRPQLNVLLVKSDYYRAGVGFKYYFTDAFSDSFYTDLDLTGGYSVLTPPKQASYSSSFIRTAGLIGYGWIFGDSFALNLALGAAYNHAFSQEAPVLKKATPPIQHIGLASNGLISGFGPTGEFSIGYNW